MKFFVHIIWVLTHSDTEIESKNQFCENVTKIGSNPEFTRFSDDF